MSSPYMKLFVADYLGDTQHLSTEQHGAYLLMLMAMWRTPTATLKDDDSMLARVVRMTAAKWAKTKPVVMTFFVVENGVVTSKRLQKEWEKAREKSSNNSQSGKLGGEAKALKTKEPALATATETPRDARAFLESRSQKEEGSKEPSLLSGVVENFGRHPTKPPSDAFARWYAIYPRKEARKAAEVAFPKAWAALAKKGLDPDAELMAGAAAYARRVAGREKSKIAHPATWLNGERWNDEETNHGTDITHHRNGTGLDGRLADRDERNAELFSGASEAVDRQRRRMARRSPLDSH